MYNIVIVYDEAKNAKNITERNINFDTAAHLDFSTALIFQDTRRDYGEPRFIAIGNINQRLHVLVFTETASGIRVISLRKANHRELRNYEKHRKITTK
ncbi:BrnT family toxin [Paenalcaligenes faecalis]|uniref:BrnT family toxin n=1 Tax=Paenalcaligenes faecalis TaxID=2980099 RepID=UPI0022B97466|nr:BrnT family toxin [Paenalcaligenes faecalis]